ncbi:MAG: HD-GYP domain-containing protein [Nitrospira sp.]|nr:HD-GYP domain-containing protein [Nitrospira sp.]MBH0197193.1 HD-GYP domain-containing protein [Nitrospira sp.]
MKKWIDIGQLQPGMRVERIDQSWLTSPFFRHRMAITSCEQIEQLKASGVQTVEVAIDGDAPMVSEAPPVDQCTPVPSSSGEPIQTGEAVPLEAAVVSFEEELPIARLVYAAAKTIVQDAMHDVRLGRALNMDSVNHVVSDMTDSVLRNADALTSLSRLKQFDEYTFYHSVNTSLLAMSLGRDLGFDRSKLHQIGVGTLLHDIGKTKIPLEILNKPGRFEPDEMEVMKQHALRGVEVLSSTTGLDDTYVRPALEHHERVDGTGYPHRRVRDELSQFGLIAAIVDIYDAITSDRCYHKGRTSHEALQFLYRISLEGHLDASLVERFIQVVGVYPVGSVIELDSGETAIVQKINHGALLEPVVLIVKSAGNTVRSSPEEVDLSQQTVARRRRIAAVKDPGSSGVNPILYLNKEAA